MAKGGFPGMGGANMQQLMKQAQKMQEDVKKAIITLNDGQQLDLGSGI